MKELEQHYLWVFSIASEGLLVLALYRARSLWALWLGRFAALDFIRSAAAFLLFLGDPSSFRTIFMLTEPLALGLLFAAAAQTMAIVAPEKSTGIGPVFGVMHEHCLAYFVAITALLYGVEIGRDETDDLVLARALICCMIAAAITITMFWECRRFVVFPALFAAFCAIESLGYGMVYILNQQAPGQPLARWVAGTFLLAADSSFYLMCSAYYYSLLRARLAVRSVPAAASCRQPG